MPSSVVAQPQRAFASIARAPLARVSRLKEKGPGRGDPGPRLPWVGASSGRGGPDVWGSSRRALSLRGKYENDGCWPPRIRHFSYGLTVPRRQRHCALDDVLVGVSKLTLLSGALRFKAQNVQKGNLLTTTIGSARRGAVDPA